MLKVERFVNELMTSNCYILWDEKSHRCVVIDPASEKSFREIDFIESCNLTLDYIILTHEHTDHTWGVNALLEKYSSAKVVCSEVCKQILPKAGDTYFRLYYEREDYTYAVGRVDLTTESINNKLLWDNHEVIFINSPGHSMGSICILIDEKLFTGDTFMQYKPYINKRNGNKELFENSVKYLINTFSSETMIYPGHGAPFKMIEQNII